MSTPQQPDDVRPVPPDPGSVPPPAGWGDVPRYGRYGAASAQARSPYGSPAGPSPYRPPADRPGIVPLRPLTLGEIYDGAFGAVRHNPAVMLGLAFLVILAATVVGVLVGELLVAPFTRFLSPVFSDPGLRETEDLFGFGAGEVARLYATTSGAALAFLLAGPIVNGILTVSVSRSVLGEKASVRDVWARVGPRVWLLLAWSLLQTVALLVVGCVLLFVTFLLTIAAEQASTALAVLVVIPMLLGTVAVLAWLGIRLLLVPPALALERAPLWATVRRAWILTRRSFWRTFGIYLLAYVIVSVIAQIIAGALGVVGGVASLSSQSVGMAVFVTTVVTTVISTAISTIFLAGVVSLMYIDLRMRREGLDVTLAATAAARGTESVRVPLTLAGIVLTDVPVVPDRDTARRWLVEELSRSEYATESSLLRRLWEWFMGLFDGIPALTAPSWPVLLGTVVVVAAVLLVARWVTGPVRLARTRASAAPLVAPDDTRTAAQLRAAADAAAARGDWSTAVADGFRAVVRGLEERTVLDVQPGRTAQEAAQAATARLPALDAPLHAGATLFDDVVYGEHGAGPADAASVRELDVAVGAARVGPLRATADALTGAGASLDGRGPT
ncbi:DUF4129 domain-containing protein [Xylanimonas allomyrinae]|uniref:DUF4129 domain-containing protein n=1 Tax=Xylanimonas allomyrinae TaxID=2509459 RepID=A0A4P6ELT5_9MICO|nr:DUF4129 domain-containing protein [Xylanimonas allomyrinae]QAY63335.1 DUF4129 domain-containing protein [Xylanimonas allomyrinae]